MKKILSLTLVFSLLLSVCFSMGAITASAESEEVYTFGDVKYRLLNDGTATIVGVSDATLTEITIPSVVDGYEVSEISRLAFRRNRVLQSVTVEEGIRSIGFQAFYECTSLKDISLPDSLRDIALSVFEGTPCYSDSAKWENGIIYIGNHLIKSNNTQYNTTLLEYTVKEGTISIAKNAFENNRKLEKVVLPDSLKAIGEGAFSQCKALRVADLPAGLEFLGWSAFNGCSLVSVTIPEKITKIENYTFRGNDFETIELSNRITSIGWDAFAGCEKLTEVTIPESITELSDGIFSGCKALATINLHDNLTDIGYSAVYDTAYSANPDNWEGGCLYIGDYLMEADRDRKGSVTVKDGTRIVAGGAFMDCYYITSVQLPDSVETIGHQAFGRCQSLSQVNIPKGLREISYYVFSECPALREIYIPDNITAIGERAFYDCPNLKTISISSSVTEIGKEAIGCLSIAPDLMGSTTSDEITIRAYGDTAAEEYAKEYGLKFEEVPMPSHFSYYGDIDVDGVVTVKDATYLQKALSGFFPLFTEQKDAGDMNCDGVLNIRDATYIQKQVAGLVP